jgi:capsular exopolysaccharide synthesis family protein
MGVISRRSFLRDEVDAQVDRLVLADNPSPLLVEQFRSLAATLLQAQAEHGITSLIVTSPAPGDGKSYIALNLALTLGESYRRQVLLIDADLRRPTLHQVFRVPNACGLSEALVHTEAAPALIGITDRFAILPAGRPEPNPLGGLSSPRLKQIIADVSSRFDFVIVDSPPVGVLADARLVSESVDAALLVVRAAVTQAAGLQAAADTLGRDRILGVVFNAVDLLEMPSQAHYHHYYARR